MSDNLQEKLRTALSYVGMCFPHVSALLASSDIRFDDRVDTASICVSGCILISPAFAEQLPVKHLAFVVTHELYHALYGVFKRFNEQTPPERRWLVNVAHDFIINEMIAKGFRESCRGDNAGEDFIPKEGLFWKEYEDIYRAILKKRQPPLDSFTLETLVLELEGLKDCLPREDPFATMRGSKEETNHGGKQGDDSAQPPPVSDSGWSGAFDGLPDLSPAAGDESPEDQKKSESPGNEGPEKSSAGAEAKGTIKGLSDLLNRPQIPELVSAELERELFPDESESTRQERRCTFEREVENTQLRGEIDEIARIQELATRGGHQSGRARALVHALEDRYETPWEAALQKSLDDMSVSERTWARASRRAGDRTDVVLPGRRRSGWQLNIVADTSGSMTALLPAVLGMIQSFGRATGLSQVRIVQCDSEVQADDVVDVEQLSTLEMKGMGDGMDPPGLMRMAEDPTVESVLVITDGYIEIPSAEDIPYDVVWCVLCENGDTSHFCPDYGRVIGVPIDGLVSTEF